MPSFKSLMRKSLLFCKDFGREGSPFSLAERSRHRGAGESRLLSSRGASVTLSLSFSLQMRKRRLKVNTATKK
jgi:hypothetical protein